MLGTRRSQSLGGSRLVQRRFEPCESLPPGPERGRSANDGANVGEKAEAAEAVGSGETGHWR